MNTITILAPDEAQKIAAGEVVERPASVIKELVENSLDAQATTVSIWVDKAGKKRIRIVDDGIGMSPQDARLCFYDHATSKITTLDDLSSLTTFGFRGEALASISAVSRTSLTTKQAGDTLGTCIKREGSKTVAQEERASQVGCDITVADLFYNTPARQKFLRQDETEYNALQTTLYAFALSNPHISFTLYRDGKIAFKAPQAKNLIERIGQLFGRSFAGNMLHVSHSQNGITVSGATSNHQFWRYNRNHMFYFVNTRFVKNSKLGKAVLKGYLNILPPNRFPASFLHISLEKNSVDVNVHPRKEEVAFSQPGRVEKVVQRAVTQALEAAVTDKLSAQAPVHHVDSFACDMQPFANMQPTESIPAYSSLPNAAHTQGPEHVQTKQHPTTHAGPTIQIQREKHSTSPQSEQQKVPELENTPKIVGQIAQTYIVLEDEDGGLTIVDQHAAHERILYEQWQKHFEKRAGTHLLFPEIVTLSEHQLKLMLEQQLFFADLGIEFEQFGDRELALKTAPPKLQATSLTACIKEAAAFIEQHESLDQETFRKKLTEHTHSHMACKAAIKAGDVLSDQEMRSLITQLRIVPNRLICIHGRPTMWTIPRRDLEKKFRRC